MNIDHTGRSWEAQEQRPHEGRHGKAARQICLTSRNADTTVGHMRHDHHGNVPG